MAEFTINVMGLDQEKRLMDVIGEKENMSCALVIK